MALRMLHDHMQIFVAKSRQRYGDYMKQNNQEKEVSEKDLKRKVTGDEMQELQKKKRFLQSTIECLRNDADQCTLDAAKKGFPVVGQV